MSKYAGRLCVIYALYLLLGGVVFMYLEYNELVVVKIEEPRQWRALKEIAVSEGTPENEDEFTALVSWLKDFCSTLGDDHFINITKTGNQSTVVSMVEASCPHIHKELVEVSYHYPWDFINALYFSMTVTTTIGYGHMSPSTSDIFGRQLFELFKSKLDREKYHSTKFIVLAMVIYSVIGFMAFIFLPSVAFSFIEDWTYLESVYYSFITLTTIGFGDFVSGKEVAGTLLYVYHMVVLVWIMTGLGYWVMLAGFITRALRSKRIHSTLQKRRSILKKAMSQMNLMNSDPTFINERSKATINFLLQLSNYVACSEDPNCNLSESCSKEGSRTSMVNLYHPTIPGIASLFAPNCGPSSTPLKHLLSTAIASLQIGPDSDMKMHRGSTGHEESVTSPDSVSDMSNQGLLRSPCAHSIKSLTLSTLSEQD